MNVLCIAGNIGNVQELRSVQTNSGAVSVLGFSVAVRTSKKGADGKYISQWFDCAMWGQRAEALAQYLDKGAKVTVSGEVDLEQYTLKDGTPGAKLKVNVRDVALQGGQPQQQAAPAQRQQPAQQPQQRQAAPAQQFNDDFFDAPF